jgi:hypothetical protein
MIRHMEVDIQLGQNEENVPYFEINIKKNVYYFNLYNKSDSINNIM